MICKPRGKKCSGSGSGSSFSALHLPPHAAALCRPTFWSSSEIAIYACAFGFRHCRNMGHGPRVCEVCSGRYSSLQSVVTLRRWKFAEKLEGSGTALRVNCVGTVRRHRNPVADKHLHTKLYGRRDSLQHSVKCGTSCSFALRMSLTCLLVQSTDTTVEIRSTSQSFSSRDFGLPGPI